MIKGRLKGVAMGAALCAAAAAYAAEPLAWERRPGRPAPAQFDTFHGETLELRCAFEGFGELPFAAGADVRLWYQTNGMGAAWWSVPATVASNVVSAAWPPSADPGADRVSFFFGAPSNAYAAAQVRFRNSPGGAPNDLAPPSVLDWVAELAALSNNLWTASAAAFMPQSNAYTKAETDARIIELSPPTSLAPATNYTDSATNALGAALNARVDSVSQAATNYADSATEKLSMEYSEGILRVRYATALSDRDTEENRTAAQIYGQIDSKTTTNDVCNIVTNETSGWTFSPPSLLIAGEYRTLYVGDDGYGEYIVCAGGPQYDLGVRLLPGESSTWDAITTDDGDATVTATWYTRNALGLAYARDVPGVVSNVVTESFMSDRMPAESDPVWGREKAGYATTGQVDSVSRTVGVLWSYVYGDKVWIAVTNYMRTVAGVAPSFQLWEVRDGATNCVYWSREEITNVTADIIHDCKTNLEATVAAATNSMPVKAWSRYQSATGAENPQPGEITIVSTPTIMLSGGWEWQRYGDVGSSVWLLKSNGMTTMGGDTNGYFKISDIDGNSQFEVVKTDSYLIDAIPGSVASSGAQFKVSFTNGLSKICVATNLNATVWEEVEYDGSYAADVVLGGTVAVTIEQSGGIAVVTVTGEGGAALPTRMFLYGKVEQAGGTVIRNAAPVVVPAGIYCTDGVHKVRPVYNNGTVTWEVVQ